MMRHYTRNARMAWRLRPWKGYQTQQRHWEFLPSATEHAAYEIPISLFASHRAALQCWNDTKWEEYCSGIVAEGARSSLSRSVRLPCSVSLSGWCSLDYLSFRDDADEDWMAASLPSADSRVTCDPKTAREISGAQHSPIRLPSPTLDINAVHSFEFCHELAHPKGDSPGCVQTRQVEWSPCLVPLPPPPRVLVTFKFDATYYAVKSVVSSAGNGISTLTTFPCWPV